VLGKDASSCIIDVSSIILACLILHRAFGGGDASGVPGGGDASDVFDCLKPLS
jgi:hypothetical protein